jgi:hypothetical protein
MAYRPLRTHHGDGTHTGSRIHPQSVADANVKWWRTAIRGECRGWSVLSRCIFLFCESHTVHHFALGSVMVLQFWKWSNISLRLVCFSMTRRLPNLHGTDTSTGRIFHSENEYRRRSRFVLAQIDVDSVPSLHADGAGGKR